MPNAPAAPSGTPPSDPHGGVRWVYYSLAVSPKHMDLARFRAWAREHGFTVCAEGEAAKGPRRREMKLPPGVTPGTYHVLQVCADEPVDYSGRRAHLEHHVVALLAKVKVDRQSATTVPAAAAPAAPKEPPVSKPKAPPPKPKAPPPKPAPEPEPEPEAEPEPAPAARTKPPKQGWLHRAWHGDK